MKKIVTLSVLCLLLYSVSEAQVGINILIPDSSAILQLESSTKGLGLPRLNTPERDSIINPLRGLTIFNTQDSLIEYWNGECWLKAYEKNCYECEFNMSLSHSTDTLDRVVGDSVSTVVTVAHTHGNQPISLIYLSSLPNGVTVYFNGNPTVDTSGSVQVVVKADKCANVGGTFPIIIEAFCGDQIHFLSYVIYIRPPVQITIPTDQTDYNLQVLNGLPASPAQFVLLNINSSVQLHASVSTNPAYTTGPLDPNSLVCIVNDGDILGRGGDGGGFTYNGNLFTIGGTPGADGGNGMNLTTKTVLQNNGAIFGGGGGGGAVGFVLSTPSIPIIGSISIGFGFCGGGGSENGLGGVVNAGGITIGLFRNGGNATCCVNSTPGLGPTANYPINIPISIATIEITPSAYGGDGGGYGQPGTRGYIDVSLQVCVAIPFLGTICIPIPIPGNFLPFYGPNGGNPGEAIKRNNNPLTGLSDGTYNSSQVKGVVGP
ncbi:MAG: hypothetical protein JWO06_431 [Bacteroidota bacterium]|nr:hypothetical protein [Bacteroidota bacterium]